jgi:hypothetical protein
MADTEAMNDELMRLRGELRKLREDTLAFVAKHLNRFHGPCGQFCPVCGARVSPVDSETMNRPRELDKET